VAWGIVYYQSKDNSIPAIEFLAGCPSKVRAKLVAVLETVRDSPPPAFSGGGFWEAMHDTMNGYYEVRRVGPGREHFRLYCILDNGTTEELAERGFDGPRIAVINGLRKPNATLFSDAEYKRHVRDLGDRYRATLPRPVAQ
jgi:hypothetical protein